MNVRSCACAVAAALLFLGGCKRPDNGVTSRPWRAFVEDLTNTAQLASLDVTGTQVLTSWDRKGGNDDFNNFVGPGSEAGWVTLADLKGPGCVRRFWTTGEDFGHPFKLYFDGERKPRLSGTIDELFGGIAPFRSPLAHYLNYCWYSYVPLTYSKSLRIEMKAPNTHPYWGPRRIFYQINYQPFAPGQMVQTYPPALTEQDMAVVARVGKVWRECVEWPSANFGTNGSVVIAAGATQVMCEATGPASFASLDLDIQPQNGSAWTQVDKEYLLQDVVMKVVYDDRPYPSIDTPVGDFFGNAWRKRYYGSMLLGVNSNVFHCAMPMPFQKSIRILLVNGADKPVIARARTAPGPAPTPSSGYLHAEWRRTGPQSGSPHLIADFKGAGKYVGCFLGVTGQEDSWWILEGDESALIDGEANPSWHGTGLEDYFNGGWYYRGPAAAALHGTMDRSPFRVAQFRHHLVDPVRFTSSFHLEIERGDQNVSVGYFRSVAYAYLSEPENVAECPPDRTARRAVDDRYARQTFMLQLFELERINNFEKAKNLIAEYVERYPDAEEDGVYRLRSLEYRRLLGENVTSAEYQPFVDGNFGPAAAQQAKILMWFYAAPNRALVGLNANAESQLFIDGKLIISGDDPLKLFVNGVELGNGPHVLAASATMKRQEPWVQMGIRTQGGVAGSGLGTWQTRTAPASWNNGRMEKTAWAPTTALDIPRDTPDAPFIGGVPNAFVLLQSKVYAIRLADWGYLQGTAYFRTEFDAPLNGWPATAEAMTGLDR